MHSLGYRHFIILLIFLGVVITYLLRVNLSVAILAMVNNTAIKQMELKNNITKLVKNDHGECSFESNSTKHKPHRDGQFLWNNKERGIILGAFFYGYVVTEIPGGWLSYRFGGKWVFGLGMLWTAIFTLLTPITVYLEMPLLIVIRVLEGLGEGVAFPCVHGLFAQWVPPSERSRVPTFTLAAVGIGTVVGFPFSGALCDSDMGWPLVFYVFGAIGIGWFIIWTIFGSSTPATNRWISQKEKEYIQNSLSEVVKEEHPSCGTVPWLEIIKTPAAWAILLNHMSRLWGLHTLITLLPTYLKEILHFQDISDNSFYAALPYSCFTISAITVGPFADYIINRRYLSVTAVRKIANTIGHVFPGLFLLLTTVTGCNKTAAVILMCVALATEGFVGPGYYSNNLDLAGRFAGITEGIYNTLGSVCGILAPVVAGIITQADVSAVWLFVYVNTVAGWRIIFGITAGFSWLATIFFLIFGRGETAEWAKVKTKETDYAIMKNVYPLNSVGQLQRNEDK